MWRIAQTTIKTLTFKTLKIFGEYKTMHMISFGSRRDEKIFDYPLIERIGKNNIFTELLENYGEKRLVYEYLLYCNEANSFPPLVINLFQLLNGVKGKNVNKTYKKRKKKKKTLFPNNKMYEHLILECEMIMLLENGSTVKTFEEFGIAKGYNFVPQYPLPSCECKNTITIPDIIVSEEKPPEYVCHEDLLYEPEAVIEVKTGRKINEKPVKCDAHVKILVKPINENGKYISRKKREKRKEEAEKLIKKFDLDAVCYFFPNLSIIKQYLINEKPAYLGEVYSSQDDTLNYEEIYLEKS